MRITIDTNDKVEVAGDKRTVSPGEAAAEQQVTVVDAGPAPVDLIRRSRAVSLDANAIDAGPTRLSVALPKSEQEMPLNPLRAGAAAATGMQVREAAASQGEEARSPASADMEGGSAPTSAAGGKPPPSAPARRGRAARGRKAKR
jgi:hypothetical protein